MHPLTEMLRAMLEKGVDHDTILLAVEGAVGSLESAKSPQTSADAQAERRREKDRERARLRRQKSADSPQTSADCGTAALVPQVKNLSFFKKESKKEERKKEELFDVESADAADLEREYFDRGKSLLGKSAGGLLVKLLRAKSNNLALARAALEQASTKQDPAEFIGAICRGPPPARPLTYFQQRQQETQNVLKKLDDYVQRCESGENPAELFPADHDQRSGGLHGGNGPAFLELPAVRHPRGN